MAMAVPPSGDGVPVRTHLAVGFADIVQFTQLSREIDEAGLAGVVELFEATAADIIAAQGGRLVKTLGDEVMFSVDAPDRAAAIALDLAAMGDRPDLPTVRVGAAYGPVLPVMGDVYGTTVNLAARLTSFARPGAVLVDGGLADGIDGLSGYSVTRIVRRPARGLGIIQPYVLRHSGTK
jgi:adenylate cyclase